MQTHSAMSHLSRRFATVLFALLAPGLAHSMVQTQAGADLAIPGRLYVQFDAADLAIVGKQTGIDAFDRKARRYGVTAVEKAFPSLEVISTHRPLSPAAEALRRVYVVQYASPRIPQLVAQDLGATGGGDLRRANLQEEAVWSGA